LQYDDSVASKQLLLLEKIPKRTPIGVRFAFWMQW
jgi:hypothetical protein